MPGRAFIEGWFIQQDVPWTQLDSNHLKEHGPQNWPEDIPPLVQRWMGARGLHNFQDFLKFTNFSLKDLTDPFLLKGMEEATDRLIKAFQDQDKICLYADFDMDGTPGLALLIQGLQFCGFQKLLSFQPNRFEDGYGVHSEIVEEFINNHEVSLFVTVDVGITAIEAVQRAKDLGVDFIITDHHQPKEILPPAYAIVNPNQGHCPSGMEHLCGAGVAFYLVLALRKKMVERGLLQKNFDPKVLLDCFAIGTLSDMVPVIKENRALIQHGLLQLERTSRPGLRLLMDELKLTGKRLNSADVSIQFSPKLNALGRMDSDVQALDLFLAQSEPEAKQLVVQTLEAQKQRAEIQAQGEATLFAKIANKLEGLSFVFEYSEDFYKGIVGLIATKSVGQLQVPSFIGTVIGDKIVGSARAPEGQSLLKALEAVSEHLVQFGGHHQAAGFELSLANASLFYQSLESYYQDFVPVPPVLKYDCVATLSELDLEFKNWFRKLEPYGVGFERPLLHLDHLFVSQIKVLKEKHLKLTLSDMDGNKIEALWFFADNIEEKKQLSTKRVSVVVQPSINEYMGRETLQVLIKDLKVEY